MVILDLNGKDAMSAHDLDRYLSEIGTLDLLEEAEEHALAIRVREGDQAAMRELVSRNLRFVVSIAKRYRNRGLPLDDLIGEGNVGLMAAARRFDPSHGVRFITYAVWWVRQAILLALVRQTRLVRVPANRLARVSRLGKARAVLAADLGREPTTAELAERMHWSPESITAIEWLRTTEVSLDAPIGDGDARAVNEQLAVDLDDDVLDAEEARTGSATIADALHTLLPREAHIVERYFGLDGSTSATLDDIAAELRVTRERVRQLRDRAIGKLRHGPYATALANLTR